MYASLEKHLRGFTVNGEYQTLKHFNEMIKKDRAAYEEIEWAYLFNADGKMVAQYKRGMVSAEYL